MISGFESETLAPTGADPGTLLPYQSARPFAGLLLSLALFPFFTASAMISFCLFMANPVTTK